MALGFSKPRLSPIAIDFGAGTLKVLQLSIGETTQLIASASRVIPEAYREEGPARLAYLAEALRDLMKSAPFKGKRAICSIPAYKTLIQPLELDRVSDDDLDQQVGLHLVQRFDVDPARMVVRSTHVGKLVRNGETKHQIVCIAARRDAVMKYIELANRCRLEVVGMHSEPMAVVRASEQLAGAIGDGEACFIDIGAAVTKLIIPHGQDLAFAKVIHAGGDTLTQDLAKAREVSFDEARLLRSSGAAVKSAVGQGLSEPAESMADATEPAGAVPDPAGDPYDNETAEALIDELRLSLRYYDSTFPERPVRRLVFLGGESRDRGLCQTIARAVSVGAGLGDPFGGIDTTTHQPGEGGVPMNQPGPDWAVALGLCQSEANL